MEEPEQENLKDVLSAIRKMVRNETRAKFSETSSPPIQLKKVKSEPVDLGAQHTKLPAKVLILHPHMKVKIAKVKPHILDKTSRVAHDTPIPAGDSFAIANTALDEGLLRDMVREVVQEQLRGELGQEIIGAIKRDMVQLMEKKP